MSSATALPLGMSLPLTLVSIISAILSVGGSGCILYMARRNLDLMLQRLLFALSVSDLGMTLVLSFGQFLLPPESGFTGTSFGNAKSCTAIGVLFSLFFTLAVCYNVYLSFYFLATVRYNWKERCLSRSSGGWRLLALPKWELALHFFTLLVPTLLAIAAAVTNNFHPHPTLPVCFIINYPYGCDEEPQPTEEELSLTQAELLLTEECVSENQTIYNVTRRIFFAYMSLGVLLSVFNSFWVYWTVRVKLRQTIRFSSTTTPEFTTPTASYSNRPKGDDGFRKRIQLVGTQAVLYGLTYVNSYVWPFIVSITTFVVTPAVSHQNRSHPGLYTLIFITCTMLPLQGLFNFLVYTRLTAQRWQRARPELGYVRILQLVLSGRPPEKSHGSVTRTTTRSATTKAAGSSKFCAPGNIQHQGKGPVEVKPFQEEEEEKVESFAEEEDVMTVGAMEEGVGSVV